MSIAGLERVARHIREDIITMVEEAGSGHVAGPLDLADIFAALYFQILRYDPKNPDWPERDRLILSCGHVCPVRYAAMAESGYFPRRELLTLRQFGSRLQGHPHNLSLPGMETTSGPLGQGLSQAAGMALAARIDGAKWRVYAVLSDAEHQEGQTWEAAMFAGNRRLHNLTVFVDRNNIQIDGMTEQIMPLEPIADKYRSFNWHVLEIDGHNMQEIIDACAEAKAIVERPTCIIAHTIAGRGVDFMEYDYHWHSKVISPEQAKLALRELRTLQGKIRSEHE